MKYFVNIAEVLARQIEIEADTEQEALDIVRDRYTKCEIVLSSDDYVDTEFSVTPQHNNG